jgi:hypothetical protein
MIKNNEKNNKNEKKIEKKSLKTPIHKHNTKNE